MRQHRFTWDSFGDAAVEGIARSARYHPKLHPEGPREFLRRRAPRPTADFVRENKDAIIKHWLADYAGTPHIVQRLKDRRIGPMTAPRTQNGYIKFLEETRNCQSLQKAISDAMLRFGDQDRLDDELDDPNFTPRFAVLKTREQRTDPRTPYSCQKEAWSKLNAHLAEHDSTQVFQGLVVMPTGSGKTFTVIRWLLQRVVNQRLRVLWLAHRQELLEQAAREFHRLSAFASEREQIRVRIVSGAHCTQSQIDPADDIIIASVMSLRARPDLRDDLLDDPKLFVVIDEAHHAPAKSYRDIIKRLQVKKPIRCLGLTATPTRTLSHERPIFSGLFGHRIIHQVELRPLIEQGLLARPSLVRVSTRARVEEMASPEDIAHLDRFGELSEHWQQRIAKLTDRNAIIIDHFLQHRVRYGKTLIFAINVPHAALLTEQLNAQGVSAAYVASYRPDGTPGDTQKIIAGFREGAFDVLVNVQIATEGVDIPNAKTVLLARPTQSEILLRQMIGRVLRGPKAGGTDKAWLVNFEDDWENFTEWENPFDLVADIAETGESGGDEEEPRVARRVGELMEHLPWDLIRDFANRMRQISSDLKADAFDAIPHGFYVIDRENDAESSYRHVISVYEHQLPCWEAYFDAIEALGPRQRNRSFEQLDLAQCFVDCDVPEPSQRDIILAFKHMRSEGAERPEFMSLQERRPADPYVLARELWDGDVGDRSRGLIIKERYESNTLAKAIYPSLREFSAAVDDARHEIQYPDEATRRPYGVPIFDPGPEDTLTPGPIHNLNRLFRETLELGQKLLHLGKPLQPKIELKWTNRIIKGWFGKAYWDSKAPSGHGTIRINRLLDSPDVPGEVLRFLLWHEFLHLHLKELHTPGFRAFERSWPTYKEGDRFLDTLNERFGVSYW